METTDTKDYITVLAIAGSDPSGGAGIQQDIKTCEAFGCYGMAAITALTAQSPTRVRAIFNTSHFLDYQLSTLLDEVHPFAVKTGMMPDAEAVESTAEAIARYHLSNVVIDPVVASTSGLKLTDDDAISTMKKLLFPLATIITPNLPEAEILTGRRISTPEQAQDAAKELASAYGIKSVLIKGGHAEYGADILYIADSDTFEILDTIRIETPNTHGTGCRLSTAIACALALRKNADPDIAAAVRSAKEWLTHDLQKNANMRFPL